MERCRRSGNGAPLVVRVLAHEVDAGQLERCTGRGVPVDLKYGWLRRVCQGVDLSLTSGRLCAVRVDERSVLQKRNATSAKLVSFLLWKRGRE